MTSTQHLNCLTIVYLSLIAWQNSYDLIVEWHSEDDINEELTDDNFNLQLVKIETVSKDKLRSYFRKSNKTK